MAMLFAATYPERTRALIVWAGQATYLRTPDTPWGISRDDYQRLVDDLAEDGVSEDYIRGGGAGFGEEISDATVRELMRYFQAGASPASIAALERMNMEIDIRDILPSIQVPTLIVNASHDPISPIEGARYLAARIPDVRLFEYEGNTHVPATREGDAMILDEIEEFVTGTRPAPPTDRVLTTILFTDIVDSTKRAATLGDAEWKRLLGQHDALAHGRIERFGGRYIESTGDGLLATFDGPARAIRCAKDLIGAVGSLGLEIRAGAHSGEVELAGDAVRGLAVHIGARVAALAGASEVWVSSTVKDLAVGSGLAFEDAGEHGLKGVPDRWRLYRVVG
jgi:class 3 adenylate cyclase